MSERAPPPEIRAEVIRLVQEGGPSPAEAAAVVGCSDQTVRNWVAQSDRDAGRRSGGLTTEERTELAQVRQGERLDPIGTSSSSRRTRLPIRIALMYDVLSVSRSGYYGWLSQPPSARALSDEVLAEKIQLAYEDSRRTYGHRRVRAELVDGHGETVSRHRVARLMKRAGIQGVTRHKFCRTTRRDDRARPAPDLLDRDVMGRGGDLGALPGLRLAEGRPPAVCRADLADRALADLEAGVGASSKRKRYPNSGSSRWASNRALARWASSCSPPVTGSASQR